MTEIRGIVGVELEEKKQKVNVILRDFLSKTFQQSR